MTVTVKKHKNGSYSVWYPEPGWVPCPCKTHVGQTEAPLVEAGVRLSSREQVLEHAVWLAGEGGSVNIVEVKK